MSLFALLCESNVIVLMNENLERIWRWEYTEGLLIDMEKDSVEDTLTLMEYGGRRWIQLNPYSGHVMSFDSEESYSLDGFIAFPEGSGVKRFAAMAAASQQLRLVELCEGRAQISGPYGIGFIPNKMCSMLDGQHILFTSHTSSHIKMLDISAGVTILSLPAGSLVADAVLNVDRTRLYACSAIEHSLRIWDLNSLHAPSRLIHTGEGPNQIVTSSTNPDRLLVYCADDCTIEERGTIDGQIRRRITLEGAMRHSFIHIHVWFHSWILLSSVNNGPYIAWWNLDTGIITNVTPLPGRPLRCIQIA